MAQQEKFNFHHTFQGTEYANGICNFHSIFYMIFCFRKPFYAPCVSGRGGAAEAKVQRTWNCVPTSFRPLDCIAVALLPKDLKNCNVIFEAPDPGHRTQQIMGIHVGRDWGLPGLTTMALRWDFIKQCGHTH